MDNEQSVLTCQQLCKNYRQGPETVVVLDNLDLAVNRGERVAIIGASGSGKSTLLNMLGGLDLPSSGSVSLDGKDITLLSEADRGQIRNKKMGFVYQFHHLLGEFSALENVAMPLLIGKQSKKKANEKSASLLQRVGLGDRLKHKPSQLSGGERQRVAIARALVNNPTCVLMDEPTGNLDEDTADTIHQLMLELNQQTLTSFIVVTHDRQLAAKMDRTLVLSHGRLQMQAADV